MSEWRYNRNGRPSDAVDQPTLEGLLKSGALPPETLVWREGMPDWVKASTLPEFAAATTPPSGSTTAIVSVPADATMPKPSTAQTSPASEQPKASTTPEPTPLPSSPPPPIGLPPTGTSLTAEKADIEQNRVFAVLAYIGVLFLVPLLAAPKSRFARYHTNQGIVLFIANIIVSVATVVLVFVPFVGCLGGVIAFAVPIASLVFMILGIVNAASGQFKPLPLIGHYELMKADPEP